MYELINCSILFRPLSEGLLCETLPSYIQKTVNFAHQIQKPLGVMLNRSLGAEGDPSLSSQGPSARCDGSFGNGQPLRWGGGQIR